MGAPGRRERIRPPRAGRHRGSRGDDSFRPGFTALGELAYAGAQVSAHVVDVHSGLALVAIDDRIVLPIASIGKILLLIEVSARISARDAAGLGLVDRLPGDSVNGSGIWQRMQVPVLPVADLALLVGSVSDNLATNALLRVVGHGAVRARAEGLGLSKTALLDRVRDERGPDDAPQLSVGSVAELTQLLAALHRGQVVDRATSDRVLGWLAAGTDLSMVSSGFGLDPLDHARSDHGLRLVNKTGSGQGVRSEVGILAGPRATLSYALSIRFADTSLSRRLDVLAAMRTFGLDLLEFAV